MQREREVKEKKRTRPMRRKRNQPTGSFVPTGNSHFLCPSLASFELLRIEREKGKRERKKEILSAAITRADAKRSLRDFKRKNHEDVNKKNTHDFIRRQHAKLNGFHPLQFRGRVREAV